MNPKRAFRHLLPLMFLVLYPMNGQAQDRDSNRPLFIAVAGDGMSIQEAWVSITGGALVTEVAETTDSRGFTVMLPTGRMHVEELTLRSKLTKSGGELHSWVKEALAGNSPPRMLSISKTWPDGFTGVAKEYIDALPVRYVFPVLDASIEESLYESLSVKPYGVGISGAPIPPSAAAPTSSQTFFFRVEGLEGFQVDPSDVLSVSIEDLVFDLFERRGTDYREWRLGQPQYGQLTVTVKRFVDSGHGLFDWWTQIGEGRMEKRDITVSIIDFDSGDVVRSYTFFDCFPVVYASGDWSLDSSLERDVVTLSVGRVDFN